MKQKRKLKNGTRYQAASISTVTTTIAPWDMGATGPANRAGLEQEAATELDPETGKETPNPNRVKRMRRVDMLEVCAGRATINLDGQIVTGWHVPPMRRDTHPKSQGE